jgi:hypothetical protein
MACTALAQMRRSLTRQVNKRTIANRLITVVKTDQRIDPVPLKWKDSVGEAAKN